MCVSLPPSFLSSLSPLPLSAFLQQLGDWFGSGGEAAARDLAERVGLRAAALRPCCDHAHYTLYPRKELVGQGVPLPPEILSELIPCLARMYTDDLTSLNCCWENSNYLIFSINILNATLWAGGWALRVARGGSSVEFLFVSESQSFIWSSLGAAFPPCGLASHGRRTAVTCASHLAVN